jgi:hypothetical protein
MIIRMSGKLENCDFDLTTLLNSLDSDKICKLTRVMTTAGEADVTKNWRQQLASCINYEELRKLDIQQQEEQLTKLQREIDYTYFQNLKRFACDEYKLELKAIAQFKR